VTALLLTLAAVSPADFRAEVAALAGAVAVEVDGRRVRIGARPSGSRALFLARRWLATRYATSGLAAREAPYEGGVNLVAPRGRSSEVVVVGAHLDTVPGTPGADDNASGSAAVLLVARALAGLRCERRVEFVHFDGEETGMRGSAAYVADLRPRNRVVAALVFDVVGYDSDGDGRMLIHAGTGERSQALVPAFLAAVRASGAAISPRVLRRRSYRTSDAVRFWDAGLPALYLTENFFGDWNRDFHTLRDDLSQLNPRFGAAIATAAAHAVARWARCR
jgi:Zn-dependent M28 family amino/carboxypeptidase